MKTELRHQCLIYEGSPSKKLAFIAEIIKSKLDEGYRCLYLNSPTMVTGLRSTLASMDMNVATEVAKARLVLSSESVPFGEKFSGEGIVRNLEDAVNHAKNEG